MPWRLLLSCNTFSRYGEKHPMEDEGAQVGDTKILKALASPQRSLDRRPLGVTC